MRVPQAGRGARAHRQPGRDRRRDGRPGADAASHPGHAPGRGRGGALPAPTGPIVAPPQSAAPDPVAAPVTLTIPLIGVRTKLTTLGLAADGELQVPSSYSIAGWYTGSPRPGAIGSAIIVGHIDSVRRPGSVLPAAPS